jgi:23S rRNA (uridine2552-2'-O)-methyltransferase
MYQPHDKYTQKALKSGFRARSIYKLEEMDEKYQLVGKGQTVLDLGAAPGSWLQYLVKKVGKSGRVYGVDLQTIEKLPNKNVIIIQADILATKKLLDSLPNYFDAIFSDAAPATSGVGITDASRSLRLLHQCISLTPHLLKPSGNLCIKIFMSPDAQIYIDKLKPFFKLLKLFKPRASRSSSKEMYIIGKGYKNKLLLQSNLTHED